MSPHPRTQAHLPTQCRSCETPTWIGDRYCRRCGTATIHRGNEGSDGMYVLDLDDADATKERAVAQKKRASKRRRNLVVLVVGVIGLIFAGSLIRSGGDGNETAAPEPAETSAPDATPTSMFRNENPPERQAALDAFESRRERAWTLDSVFDAFGIAGGVQIHEENSTVWLHHDADGTVSEQRSAPGLEFGPLGPVTAAPYRVGPDNPVEIETFDVALDRWRAESWSTPPTMNSLAPFAALAVSPTHVAAEAGGLVRMWNRRDGAVTATIPGRLRASTGDLFFIGDAAYDSTGEELERPISSMLQWARAGVRLWDDLNGDGVVQEQETAPPAVDGDQPIRSVTTPEFTALIDPSGWLVTRAVQEPRLAYNGAFVDLAVIADGSAVLALSVDSLLVLRFDGLPPIEVPVDIDGARALTLVPPAS